jgi:16S rRNA (guanine527-N7)-methyltransferase
MPEPVRARDGLNRVLSEIQRRGAIGRGSIPDAIEHALQFVAALPAVPGVLVDLGSGGGLPGLVIAVHAPLWHVHLVERRAKRADLLRYAVTTLALESRVDVHEADADALARAGVVRAEVVTARSFGPPVVVLETASAFLRSGGVVIVSEPPDDRPRCADGDLVRVGFVDEGRFGAVRRYRRAH